MGESIVNKIRDRHNMLLAIVMFGLCTAWIVYLFPREARFKYEYELGKSWQHEELRAPFEFALRKSQSEIDSTRAQILSIPPAVYQIDSEIAGMHIRKFREAIAQNGTNYIEGIGSAMMDSTETVGIMKSGVEILAEVYSEGIVDLLPEHQKQEESFPVILIHNNVAVRKDKRDVLDLRKAIESACLKLNEAYPEGTGEFCSLLQSTLTYNAFFDIHKSDLERIKQLESYSEFEGKVEKGQIIIRPGDIVSATQLQMLDSFAENYKNRLGHVEGFWIIMIGQFLLVGLCMLSMALFIRMFNPEALALPSRVLFLLVLAVLATVMAKFALQVEVLNIYLAPICILPIIIRTFYDARMALLVHVVVVFIVSFITPNPFEFAFLQVFAGILLLYGIRNLRSRSQFFNSSFVIFASYSITYFGWNILQEGQLTTINWTTYAWFGGNALLSLFAYPLIFLFEKSFGFLSEVSLMELADSNTPILRELNEKAPGTFQHTLQVANLAEEAIRMIGGDVLLVRAGAMYHDIGKMSQPEFFIENQSGLNPHDEMSAEESAKVIISHVTLGIEIAKKNGIPDKVIDFIRTHHGTTRTEYFYRTALKDNEEITQSAFTYPGPKPFSKETAVLMMADSVEAASRSLKVVDKTALEQLIDKVVSYQIGLDQFTNSDLTFRDIGEVKQVFLKKLMNIYHVRIEYPDAAISKPV